MSSSDIRESSIDVLGLLPRTRSALQRYKKDMTVGDLCAMTSHEVYAIAGLPQKGLDVVRAALKAHGLTLAPEPPPPPSPPARADDGLVELIEKPWAEAIEYEREVHKNVYLLQHLSMEFSQALSRL